MLNNTEAWLMDTIKRNLGYEPVGFKNILRTLGHPDVRPMLNQYLEELDDSKKAV